MLFLGIDIGKRTHVASLISEKGQVLFKAFSFNNTLEGGEALINKLQNFVDSYDEIEVGMEATGHYWLSLYSFLIDQNLKVYVVNPLQTDGWRKGTEIRKRKTDIIDSLLIAELIRYGDFLETTLANDEMLSLRNLSRFRNYLIQSTSDLKRKAIAVLDQVFPEYETVFSNIFGKTSKEILLHFSSASDFESITANQLNEALEQFRMKKFAQRKIQALSTLAPNSFGIKIALDSFSLQLKMIIEQLNFIESQIQNIESELELLLQKLNSPITTIPGIGPVNAAVILGEIGDIKRFSTPAKLVAYAGLDATVSQSGEYSSTSNRMSKRGSPHLRTAIFSAAFIASNNDPVFKAYYEKKRAEGKHHFVAVNAVARKMCNTIHAILTQNVPYDSQMNR
ncbi:IS110 family transposase [Fusibacter paucivorans]|uniref:IS110 family transposase n=1 Tax=Fusibacter paucivorans TaxID=76009 RepID=A0ABS5PV95_9FIRM|nr:IS110 family transposase [Fusibacter paucivorans]MBS7528862.1 IS110 family transposase [Fusibacter paucivorans]MDK2868733.1 transposase [Clostridiales bacterium]